MKIKLIKSKCICVKHTSIDYNTLSLTFLLFLFFFRYKDFFHFLLSFFKYETENEINNRMKINIGKIKSQIIDEEWFVEKVSLFFFFFELIFFRSNCHIV